MTILGPLIMASLMIVPIWISQNSTDTSKILLVDEHNLFNQNIQQSEKEQFHFTDLPIEKAKLVYTEMNYVGLLHIPKLSESKEIKSITYYSSKSAGIALKSKMEKLIEERINEINYSKAGIDIELIKSLKTNVEIDIIKHEGVIEKKNNTEISTFIGLISSVLIYFFIFLYGSQIMRGVMEEKTGRIVEIIISSVKPFQLMMGKIVGIALVGLTQFLLWIVLSFMVTQTIYQFFGLSKFDNNNIQQTLTASPDIDVSTALEVNAVLSALETMNIPLIVAVFIFYFIGGYLFYGTLFAAIGSAVDSESDTQQFMLPITVPMILGIMVAQSVMENPESNIAFWFSIIPFTSPIVMMIRLPFIGASFDLFLSMFLLIVGFFGTTWMAAKIYRVGILTYGKKVGYSEILKWIKNS